MQEETGPVAVARYDGVAEWFDRELATSELGVAGRRIAQRLLGTGPGLLLDVGCGGGSHAVAFATDGWSVTGVDISDDQLALARERGVDVVKADACTLPFDSRSFDAAVSMWTHTDVDDFSQVVLEVARVLRPGGPFVYLGVHPCFVGPHSRFVEGVGVPELHHGYREERRYSDGPGVTTHGLRARVGATHLTLGHLLAAFLDAGLELETLEEPETRTYPIMLALRCRR